MDYSEKIASVMKKNSISVGQKISIEKDGKMHEGMLMPNTGDPNCLVVKLDSGYNIGIAMDDNAKIRKIAFAKEKSEIKKQNLKHDPSKPTIAILHTGGTIASKIDYNTGAVKAIFDAEDLVEMVPELADIANIRSRMIFQMSSEDMNANHWEIIAKEVLEEINEGCDGIIIGHGTDTMHYTSAALSFLLRDIPIPVILVGAQRSPDRGSSDAAINLICAAQFISDSDFAGIAICMHESSSDNFCYILPSCKTRKMHTSRRDAFRPINSKPIANIDYNLRKVEFIEKNYTKKDPKRMPKADLKFSKKVALVKIYPGFRAEQLDWYEKNCEGIVLEGTGLGHTPIAETDQYTKNNPEIEQKLKQMTEKGILVYMASQCIHGRVNMNVYTNARKLLTVGVKPVYMLPEVAFIKLGWVLGHTKDPKEIDKLMQTNLAGEIISRSELDDFPDKELEK